MTEMRGAYSAAIYRSHNAS